MGLGGEAPCDEQTEVLDVFFDWLFYNKPAERAESRRTQLDTCFNVLWFYVIPCEGLPQFHGQRICSSRLYRPSVWSEWCQAQFQCEQWRRESIKVAPARFIAPQKLGFQLEVLGSLPWIGLRRFVIRECWFGIALTAFCVYGQVAKNHEHSLLESLKDQKPQIHVISAGHKGLHTPSWGWSFQNAIRRFDLPQADDLKYKFFEAWSCRFNSGSSQLFPFTIPCIFILSHLLSLHSS